MQPYSFFSDKELIDLLKSGDRVAFTEIYDRYKGVLYIHAYKRLRSREDVRDIIHELFATLWQKRADIVISSQLSGYLYQAVRNRVIDFLSRKKVESDYISGFQSFINLSTKIESDYLVREKDLKQLIEKEIDLLPPKMREVFELSRQHQLSHREIAQKLNISEKTVKKHVNNALKILRVRLGVIIYLIVIYKIK